MDIRIKTTDYELTSETREYLDDRIASLEKILPGKNNNPPPVPESARPRGPQHSLKNFLGERGLPPVWGEGRGRGGGGTPFPHRGGSLLGPVRIFQVMRC